MNAKPLFSAFALVAFLSCQNQPDAPSAPQSETGTLALRVVSSKALAQVDFVTVSLSWGSDMKVERTSPWDAPSIKLDGLPLGVRLSVHMEGWNDERGRKVVVWSGDAYAQLTGDANWDLNNEAPIVIVSAAPAATPNLSTLLPAGYALVGDSLRLLLGSGKTDTIRLGGQGVDSVLLDDKNLAPVDGKFPIVLVPGDHHQVVVVGTNGMTTTFRVSAAAKLPSARELVVPNTARSWSNDTLSFSLPDGASDTIRIGTSGVDSLWVNGSKVLPEGGTYRVVVKAPSSDSIVVKGAAGQSVKFNVLVSAIQKADFKPGLVADFKLAPPSWVGAICSVRVAMDSGKVDSVVMLKPDHIAFAKVNDSLWKLDWNTKGASDSLKVRVYGQGSKGTDSVDLIRYVSFDRDAPTIRVADLPSKGFLFGKAGGAVAWKAIDRGLATTWATDAGDAKVACNGDTCLATGVKKSFVIHAKDELGNDTSVNVSVSIDSAGPTIASVKDAAGNGLGKGDTLWIDSAVASGAVVVAANDALSGMVIVAERAAPQEAIQERISFGSATIPKLTVGIWTLRATDDFGNGTPWGNLVVAIRPAGAVVSLGAYLKALPKWVGASCSVQVEVTSGTIDTVVAAGLRFVSSGNKTIWTAVWKPSKIDGVDSLKLMVHGQGSKVRDSVELKGAVSIDRTGPAIVLKSVLHGGVLRVGKNGGEIAVSVQDERGVDSVWFKGGAKIAMATGDSLHRATVRKTDTVMARDSLGNVGTQPITVVLDSTAPSSVTLEDGLKKPLADGGYVHRDTTGVAKLVVKATDSSGFLVRLMNGTTPVRTVAGVDGVAILDSLPVGFLTVVIEDSLGNTFVRNGKQAWGDAVVRIRPPVINKPAGTYGAGDTKYVKFVEWVDALPIAMTCPDGGTAYAKPHEDTASVAWQKAWTNIFGTETYDIRCIKGAEATDTSEIVTRTYNVLQRPWIKQNDTTFTGSSLIVEIARGSGVKSNPEGAKIQYCLGDSLTCVAATWSTYSAPVVISTSTTLWARVAYEGKYSHAAKRTYTKTEKNLAWGLDFSQAAYDTASIRTNYGGVVWSFQTIDTIKANIANGHMSINAIWLMEGRLENQWGLGGITIPLDKEWGTYDFSKVDSITFDYKTSGTLNGLYFYPVHKDDDGSAEGPQYFVLPSVGGDLNHVIFKTTDIATPQWGAGLVTWPAIQNAIEAIRFGVAPETATTGKGFPAGPSGAVMIDNVRIYGIITKN